MLLRNCKHFVLKQFIHLLMLCVYSTPRHMAASFSGVSATGLMLTNGSKQHSRGDGSSVGAAGSRGKDVVPKSVFVVDPALSTHGL